MTAPSTEAAYDMGAKGGPVVEEERLAFEAWIAGHCWALNATWNGRCYVGIAESISYICPQAMQTRILWAAWRDRAALAENETRSLDRSKNFYHQRCEALHAWQKIMRDPEREIVCQILANGFVIDRRPSGDIGEDKK